MGEKTTPSKTERRIIETVARNKWADLKSTLKRAGLGLSPFRVEIQEKAYAISLTRYRGESPIASLTVTFDPVIPRVLFRCAPHHRNGEIRMILTETELSFVVDGIIRLNEDELSATLLSYLTGRR